MRARDFARDVMLHDGFDDAVALIMERSLVQAAYDKILAQFDKSRTRVFSTLRFVAGASGWVGAARADIQQSKKCRPRGSRWISGAYRPKRTQARISPIIPVTAPIERQRDHARPALQRQSQGYRI